MNIAQGSDHLLDYWSILVRRRWVIYLSVTALTLLALIASFIATPYYKATATLQIERYTPNILTFRDLSQVDYSWTAYSDFYQTQYKLIASSAVARRAVKRADLLDHPDFKAAESEPGLLSRLKALIPSRAIAGEVSPEERIVKNIQGSLEVAPVRNSHLVDISWIAPDPTLAARVANAVAEAYVQFNIESRYSSSDQAEEFLVNQTGQLKREIAEIEEALLQYGEAKSIVSIDDSNNITLQALEDIAHKRTAAQTKLAEAEAAYRAVMTAPPEALPEVANSSLITMLRQEYAAYEAEYSEKSRRFKDDWPGLQTLKSKLDQARIRLEYETELIASQVRASAEAAYRIAIGEVGNFDSLLADQENAAQMMKRDAVEYANLQSEVRKKRETLAALLGRQNEMALSARLKDVDSSTNIRIMERAQPPAAPFRPRTRFNLFVGFIMGLMLGIGMSLFIEYLDNTINSADDLEKIISMPTLAVIARHGGKASSFARVRRKPTVQTTAPSIDLVAHLDSQATTTEAYRELRTSLLLANPGSPPRRIMVTSANPEEGKTATATNLAIVLAQLGKKVALVDTDLRRPRLHKVFDVDNSRGVSTCLSGLEKNPERLMKGTTVQGLDLLPSGPIPPNPSELLNSVVFSNLGRKLLERGYDHIVFDSPPALSVSDPVIISSVIDYGILVVRAGQTVRQSVKLAADKLRQAKAGHFGAVINDVDLESLGSRYSYYHRYAGHEDDVSERQDGGNRTGSATA
jgi:capsular exopolysaccharide synthesis family protein